MAKITLADGMVIEGTAEELRELAEVFGEVAEATEKEVPEDFDLRTKDDAGDERPERKPMLEVGDVVRVAGETYYGDFEEGTLAIVSYFDENKTSGLARIVIETEDDIDRTSADNLELVAKAFDRKDV